MRGIEPHAAERNGPFVLTRRIVSPQEFVCRWEQLYAYSREELYDGNIGRPLTPARIAELFEWKNGGPLARQKAASVRRNYIDRLPELRRLNPTTPPDLFLQVFSQGGAISRIYWLHLWRPDRYPIYDQHVHRAMT
jgi:hypothetical protein